jgi:hypothetical protein
LATEDEYDWLRLRRAAEKLLDAGDLGRENMTLDACPSWESGDGRLDA